MVEIGEGIIYRKLNQFLEDNNLFSNNDIAAFVKVNLVLEIMTQLQILTCLSIFLDVSKAFYTVSIFYTMFGLQGLGVRNVQLKFQRNK